ncbi:MULTISPECIES: winged helix-turn-helix domain-containing protein [unclassified Serratia (in: enterobacteria)]|uniref:winged helix-turn-helix domain-containing protein n=1 Tax=unclassified Serratia (in: enterobacteria) TaxID=2647522 RepID=UPI00068DC579|nr:MULTISPECIES: winged helix-turn-helix domain-containing protein [unclassified Serratia (in: enterobacteria)]
MKYIIDKKLILDSDEKTLFLAESPEEYVEIGAVSARLFVEMLENIAGVDREYLLDTVWSNHGLRPSNNNLNNHISQLRKSISSLIDFDDLIVTLPKKGFMINKRYTIHSISEPIPTAPPVRPEKDGWAEHYPMALWLLSIVVIILSSLLGYIVTRDHYSIFGLC